MEREVKQQASQPLPLLPEDLVEKIISMMPFPQIFKATALSKSWRARFFPLSSLVNGSSNLIPAASFQKEVGERSNSWETLCPLAIATEETALCAFGYDRACATWRSMPSLEFLPNKFLERRNLQMEGSLLYALPLHNSKNYRRNDNQFFVANILTRKWKQVPPFGDMGSNRVYCETLVSIPSSESYKVIRFCRPCGVHVYDSTSDSWSSRELVPPYRYISNPTTAHHNGMVYMTSYYLLRNLVAYDIEKARFQVFDLRTFQGFELIHSSPYSGPTWPSADLLVCNDSLLMLLTAYQPVRYLVLKVDVELRELTEVARGPPAGWFDEKEIFLHSPVSTGKGIFFGMEMNTECRVPAYDMESKHWSCSPFPSFPKKAEGYNTRRRARGGILGVGSQKMKRIQAFQPGLIPFCEV